MIKEFGQDHKDVQTPVIPLDLVQPDNGSQKPIAAKGQQFALIRNIQILKAVKRVRVLHDAVGTLVRSFTMRTCTGAKLGHRGMHDPKPVDGTGKTPDEAGGPVNGRRAIV